MIDYECAACFGSGLLAAGDELFPELPCRYCGGAGCLDDVAEGRGRPSQPEYAVHIVAPTCQGTNSLAP
jgi:hypothetical protein